MLNSMVLTSTLLTLSSLDVPAPSALLFSQLQPQTQAQAQPQTQPQLQPGFYLQFPMPSEAMGFVSTSLLVPTVHTDYLPRLAEPDFPVATLLSTGSGGVMFKGELDGSRLMISPDFTGTKGNQLDVAFITKKIANTSIGWLVSGRQNQSDTVVTAGWRFGTQQQLLLSVGQQRQKFSDGVGSSSPLTSSQLSSGLNYRYFIDKRWFDGLELSSYYSTSTGTGIAGMNSASLNGVNTSPAVQSGANLSGVLIGLETSPLSQSKLALNLGRERLAPNSGWGGDVTRTTTSSISWSQIIFPTVRYQAKLEDTSVERRFSTGLDLSLSEGQQLGLKLERTAGSDGQVTDSKINISYKLQFGRKSSRFVSPKHTPPWNPSLLSEVQERPAYMPTAVVSKSE